jgi:hypothetical protein
MDWLTKLAEAASGLSLASFSGEVQPSAKGMDLSATAEPAPTRLAWQADGGPENDDEVEETHPALRATPTDDPVYTVRRVSVTSRRSSISLSRRASSLLSLSRRVSFSHQPGASAGSDAIPEDVDLEGGGEGLPACPLPADPQVGGVEDGLLPPAPRRAWAENLSASSQQSVQHRMAWQ